MIYLYISFIETIFESLHQFIYGNIETVATAAHISQRAFQKKKNLFCKMEHVSEFSLIYGILFGDPVVPMNDKR